VATAMSTRDQLRERIARREAAERDSVNIDRIKAYEENHPYNADFIIIHTPTVEERERAELEEAYELHILRQRFKPRL
jgi:hypothetical protein